MASSGRRRVLAVLGAVAVLAVVGGGGWYAYRLADEAPPAEVPLIRAESGPVKTRPADPGGLDVPNQDKLVYRVVGDDGGEVVAERLLPPPEEPLPPPEEEEASPPPVEPSAGPAEASAEPSETTVVPAANIEVAAPPAPPPAKPGRAKAAPPAGVLVQLAAFKNPGEATAAWSRIHRANRDLLGDLTPAVVRADLGSGKIFYRLRAGPFASAAEARALCAKLKSRKMECLVVDE